MKVSECTMSDKERFDDKISQPDKPIDITRQDPLADTSRLISQEIPSGTDRRTFLMRSAVVSAAVAITGSPMSAQERAKRSAAPAPTPPLSPDLNVVKQEKGPVMTTVD